MKKRLLYSLAFLCLIIASCKKDANKNGNLDSKTFELVTLKSGAIVEKKGDKYIWQGDMVLSSAQFKNLDQKGTIFGEVPKHLGPDTSIHPVYNIPMLSGSNNTAVPRAFGIYPTSYNMWAMVRFTYNANLPSWLKDEIKNILLQYQASTNVRFYNATGQPTVDPTYGFAYPYIDFVYAGAADVSDSYVGRQGGRQAINLADFVQYQPSAIIHEIGHSIGLLHEQQRPDRDTYVNINTSNLTSSGQAQFQKITTNYYTIGTYDYNSVMGYGSYTSSTSVVHDTNQPMYTKKDGSSINQGYQLSNLDQSWVNTFYIPYIARSDTYAELDNTVYKQDGTVMTTQERLDFQAQLNNGDPNPPACCRIPNNF